MAVAERKDDRRAQARERRRQQLIRSTIRCIADKGLGGITLSDVARDAGLSQGIVNLHFDSKDNLLTETLRYLAEDYDAHFMQTLETESESAAATLHALMAMDLSRALCERRKLSVWFAFWGEVKAVPTYQKICVARERKYTKIMNELTSAIIAEGGYKNVAAETVTETLSALTDGMWLSCLISPRAFDRTVALDTVTRYLQAIFPQHFPMTAAMTK